MYLLIMALLLLGCAQQSPFPTLQDLQASSPIHRYDPKAEAEQAQRQLRPVTTATMGYSSTSAEATEQFLKEKARAEEEREIQRAKRSEELDQREARLQKEYQAWEREQERKAPAAKARMQALIAQQRAKMTPAERQREDAENEAVRTMQRLQNKLRAAEACYKFTGRVC